MAPIDQLDVTAKPLPGEAHPAAGPGRSLRVNFLWTLLGIVSYAGCQWGILVVLAKLGDVEMVGEFGLALAVTAPVLMFTNLYLRGVQATDARGEYGFGDYLALRLLTTAAGLAIITGLAFVFGTTTASAAVIIGVGLAKAAEAVSDVCFGLLQKHERMDRIALSQLAKGALSLVALGVTVHVTHSLLWGVVAMALSWLVVLAGFDLGSVATVLREAGGSLRPRLHAATLRRLAHLALPLGVVMFIVSFTANIPRYFIEHYHGLRDLGVFVALAYLIVAVNRLLSALGESTCARLARYYADGDRAGLRVLLVWLLVVSVGLGLGLILVSLVAGRELLTVLYRPEFADAAPVLVWVAVGGLVSNVASALGYAMTAMRRFAIQAPLFIAVGLVTAAACALLVPEWGLIGAAWAMALGQSVQVVGGTLVVMHALKRRAA